MRLAREARARYARQISLPEIGEAGQARLLSARVALDEYVDGSAGATAALYLERAGMTVVSATCDGRAPFRVEPGDPVLAEAASYLGGALTAVEVIKSLLGVGTPLAQEATIWLKEPRS